MFTPGIVCDVRNRIKTYSSDWSDVRTAKMMIVAAGVFIALSSIVPALAFGVQLQESTDGTFDVAHVIVSTSVAGLVQVFLGGQPLLVVGVSEPIVLIYKFMYNFISEKDGMDGLFLPWAAWTCVWSGLFLVMLAWSNACSYISKFTRFAGESFGFVISILFLQEAIKGIVRGFDDGKNEPLWQLINGMWGLIISTGFCASALVIRTGNQWKYFNGTIRSFLTNYGVPLFVVVWSGISYAITSPGDVYPAVPRRVATTRIWELSTDSWTTISRMKDVPGEYIAAALVPALIVTVLFYFDHNVSSQLTRQEEFNFTKETSFNWDLFLLGIITMVFGMIGLPPVNGVIPQSPMHSKMVSIIKKRDKGETAVKIQVVEQRVSGLIQSIIVGTCLFIMPAIECIPTAVLWGYFAFMAIESLEDLQVWERIRLIFTDSRKRISCLEQEHSSYIEKIKFKTIVAFTTLQIVFIGGIYAVTWAGIAGVLFPVPILCMVPFRQYILPKFFDAEDLELLDKFEEEKMISKTHDEAVHIAESMGISKAVDDVDDVDVVENEFHNFRVIHHIDEDRTIV